MRTFSGEKLSAIGEVGKIQIRDTSIPSFYPVFSMAKPVRRMSVRPKIVLRRLKNRLQQNGKSFGADYIAIFVCHKAYIFHYNFLFILFFIIVIALRNVIRFF